MNRHVKHRRANDDRQGAVVVEFAICAPLLFLFFFAALEFSRVNMIRQTVENAVYEGCRRGVVPGATADGCRAAAQSVLNSVSALGADIDVTPATITDDSTEVTVAIVVPINENSWVTPFFFENMSVSGSMTLRRERYNNQRVP
jgi:Flp pilus assembly protein TadG